VRSSAFKKRFGRSYVAILLSLSSLPLAGHDATMLDAMPSKHGGRVRMAGPFHVELVLSNTPPSSKSAPIWVYLQNHSFEDVSAKALAVTIDFIDGTRTTSAVLQQKGFNLFFGSGVYKITPTLQVNVQLKSGAGAFTAEFNPFEAH